MNDPKQVTIYTDGACINNPGPGGYGVILIAGDKYRELSAGYRLTTNNRMELMAAIAGLQALRFPCQVVMCSDSRYVVDGIAKGWALKWRSQGWMRSRKERAINSDLWEQLLSLCERHTVNIEWIRGHAGHIENERCDRLSVAAASGEHLLEDSGYVEGLAVNSDSSSIIMPTLIEDTSLLTSFSAHQAGDVLEVLGKPDNHVRAVRQDSNYLYLALRDDRELRVPLMWFPRLYQATVVERQHYSLAQDGLILRFPDLHTALNIEYLLGFPGRSAFADSPQER